MTGSARALSFETAADRYAAHRPSYPPALLDAVEELTGRPLAGARAADVGAGTGIATALLRDRGAEMIAVEPGAAMAGQLRAALPGVPLVRGDGNALPLATGSRDLLTFAQSWHWTRPDRSVPEARRVLRPGGALALWWNTSALDAPWTTAQAERVARHTATPPPSARRPEDAEAFRRAGVDRLPAARRLIRWQRTVSLDTHLGNLTSHSAFLVREKEDTRRFAEAERARLLELFPDGQVEEAYVVDLLVATVP